MSPTDQWFSFSVRRNRKSFVIAELLLFGIMLGVVAVLWLFSASRRSSDLILLMFFVPYVLCGYSLTAQRLRDMNLTGWLALLWLPIGVADSYIGGAASIAFLIVLCTVPGTSGANRYGPDPLYVEV